MTELYILSIDNLLQSSPQIQTIFNRHLVIEAFNTTVLSILLTVYPALIAKPV